jgi:hypothetical protein
MALDIYAISLSNRSDLPLIERSSPPHLIANNQVVRTAGIAPIPYGRR